jgi:serine/threonine protein kinase
MPPAASMVGNRFVLVAGDEQAGGIADIRKAVDIHRGGLPVAIKLLREVEKDVTLLTFFEREKDSLQALNHPNIIGLVDAGWDEGIGRFYNTWRWNGLTEALWPIGSPTRAPTPGGSSSLGSVFHWPMRSPMPI